MSTKILYPPIIESFLPACVYTQPYTINFQLSPFLSWNDIKELGVIIRKQSDNQIIIHSDFSKFTHNNENEGQLTLTLGQIVAWFDIDELYKIQLSFKGENYESEWSSIGLFTVISQPYINMASFNNLTNENEIITFSTTSIDFMGVLDFLPYDQQQPEKTKSKGDFLKSYYFELYEGTDDSKKKILQSENLFPDVNYPNQIKYSFDYWYESGISYTAILHYTTNNGYQGKATYLFQFIPNVLQSPELEGEIVPDNDLGFMKISVNQKVPSNTGFLGFITIRRSSSETNFKIWEDIHTQAFYGTDVLNYVWYDKTIESGIWYKYSVEKRNTRGDRGIAYQLNKGKAVCVYLDDILISDNDRVLRVQFNPKVTNLKANRSEQKIDTLGSKYPVITRNGNLNYRTFTVSGLISFKSDFTNHFMTETELYQDNDISFNQKTELAPFPSNMDKILKNNYDEDFKQYPLYYNDSSGYSVQQADQEVRTERRNFSQKLSNGNMYTNNRFLSQNFNSFDQEYVTERIFREKVIEFLSDGKPKLFRSIQEGNFLVVFMGVSLTPNEQLGRKIYTITANAVEIDECSIKNYDKYGIQKIGEIFSNLKTKRLHYGQVTITAPTQDNVNLIKTAFAADIEKLHDQSENIQYQINSLKSIVVKFLTPKKKIFLTSSGEYTYKFNYNYSLIATGHLLTINEKQVIITTPIFQLLDTDTEITSLELVSNSSDKVSIEYTCYLEQQEDTSEIPLRTYITSTLGQYTSAFPIEESVIDIIKNKYKAKTSTLKQSLSGISKVTIEDQPNAVYRMKQTLGLVQEHEGDFAIGSAGRLTLDVKNDNIKELYYIGQRVTPTLKYLDCVQTSPKVERFLCDVKHTYGSFDDGHDFTIGAIYYFSSMTIKLADYNIVPATEEDLGYNLFKQLLCGGATTGVLSNIDTIDEKQLKGMGFKNPLPTLYHMNWGESGPATFTHGYAIFLGKKDGANQWLHIEPREYREVEAPKGDSPFAIWERTFNPKANTSIPHLAFLVVDNSIVEYAKNNEAGYRQGYDYDNGQKNASVLDSLPGDESFKLENGIYKTSDNQYRLYRKDIVYELEKELQRDSFLIKGIVSDTENATNSTHKAHITYEGTIIKEIFE